MYHYVRHSRDTSPGGIRPLFVSEFEKQLDWLKENFRLVSPDQFLSGLRSGFRSSRKPLCLLTFDDGTRDHLEVVFPILQRRSLQAVFFVLTWPSEEQKLPVTHALHWLLGQPEHRLWDELKSLAETMPGGIRALGAPEDAARIYHYESPLRASIKYAINFALPPDVAQQVIAHLLRSNGKTPDQLVVEWFLTASEIQRLHSGGMDIGMHGCSHRSLRQLGAEGVRKEIAHSSSYLKGLVGEAPIWFSPPFGGSDISEELAAIHEACRRANVEAIVTTRKGLVTSKSDAYDIPRYDCIYLPPRGNDTEILPNPTRKQRYS